MSLWTLLAERLPVAGEEAQPFDSWRDFFSNNCLMANPLAALSSFLSLKSGGRPLFQASGNLEYALRLSAAGVSGAALIGVPKAQATFGASLDAQAVLLQQMAQKASLAAEQEKLLTELFQSVYPRDGRLDWLAPQARALLLGLAYKSDSGQAVVKPYFTTNLDNTRSHAEILAAALAILSLTDYTELAVAFDEFLAPVSVHRGLGLDMAAGSLPRVKIYHRISWLAAARLTEFAQRWALPLSENLWHNCQQLFCPDGNAGLTAEFEVALVLSAANPPKIKCNFFFTAEQQGRRAAQFVQELGWDMTGFNNILTAGRTDPEVRAFLHGLAMDMSAVWPEQVNLYFM